VQKSISVITPTYNYGHLIHRLLDSILIQTYKNIEKFRKKGFKLIYQYQENQGQAVAMDAGLKLITGDYFIWP